MILPVRGSDPTLGETIQGLLRQDYPDFQIHIIVDHPSDPAWEPIQNWIAQFDSMNRCRIEPVLFPGTKCGLKSAAIAQVVRELHSVEVIITIDADVAPHPTWLRDIVAPFDDPRIGAVTGNHWFEPQRPNPGSLLRSLWNAGALIPAAFFGNPWGGSCAFRLADLRQCGLIEAWETSAVDDGPVRAAFDGLERRVVFSPAHIMINRESCSLRFCFDYVSRILTWSRVYESTSGWTLAHALVNGTPWAAALVGSIIAAVHGDQASCTVLLLGLALHALLLGASYFAVRHAVARIARAAGRPFPRIGLLRSILLIMLTPLAFGMHVVAVLRAWLTRYVCWRGIWYYIVGPRQVSLLSYRPFSRTSPNTQSGPESSL